VAAALTTLPERQRAVVSLRDVHGLSADEVCSLLEVSPANQRVLLHRGRVRLRSELEVYYSRQSQGVGR
jgi:RNA polymerase sigma-70 factor (ECF subfamily)